MWDAAQYLRFGGERARPFFDLVAQVGATSPGYVADLGCGPGHLTAALAQRWPDATVVGVDNSPEMIAAAQAAVSAPGHGTGPLHTGPLNTGLLNTGPLRTGPLRTGPPSAPHLSFSLGDVWSWRPARPLDVLTCNAVLQWVPDHDELLLRWADLLAPGGWLAFQLPGNFDQATHVILRELAKSPRWRGQLGDVQLNRQAGDPRQALSPLARAGYAVDAWETSYLHILHGDTPVLDWTRGTALRPVLAALDADQAEGFLAEYGKRLHEAYRPQPFGTVFPF